MLKYIYVASGERLESVVVRRESKVHSELQQEAYMKIGEIAFHGIQKQDVPHAALIKPRFIGAVLDYTIQDLADEHRHRVLVEIVAYRVEGMPAGQVPCRIECGTACFRHIRLKYVQGQKEGRLHFGTHALHHKTAPPVIAAQRMEHHRIFSELGGVEDDKFRIYSHLAVLLFIKPLRHCAESLPPVGDFIFLLFRDVGECSVGIFVGNEDRVITEASVSRF